MLTKLKHKVYTRIKNDCFNCLRSTPTKQKMYLKVLSRFQDLVEQDWETLDLVREALKEDLE